MKSETDYIAETNARARWCFADLVGTFSVNTPNQSIENASVKVMLSYDYCHFEVCLSSSAATTPQAVDELRKTAARLADKAVAQYKVAKNAEHYRENMRDAYSIDRAKATPENERTPDQKARIKYHSDVAFAAQYDYDYDDDWDQP